MNALPVLPLGGKHSFSPVVVAELAAFAVFRADLQAVGPVNSNERAHALRVALVRDNPALAKDFLELNLSH